MNRYIKIWDAIEDSPVYAHPAHLKLWLHLLLRANLKDRFANVRTGTGFTQAKVGRGQLIASRATIAEKVGMDENFVYRALEKFEIWGMIKTEVVNRQFTLLTICNYDTYNPSNFESEQPVNNHRTAGEQRANSRRTAGEQPVNTLYEGNEGKEGDEGNDVGEEAQVRPRSKTADALPAVMDPRPEPKNGKGPARVQTQFQKPEISEIVEYMDQYAAAQVIAGRTTGDEVSPAAEAESMFNHYEANGWKVGRNPLKDWRAAARGWFTRSVQFARDRAKRTGAKTGFGEGIAAANIANQIMFPDEKR